MTLHVDPKHLASALSKILAVVERRTTIPVLSHVLISAGAGAMKLRGTDLDIEISIEIPCEGEIDEACVPAERLYAVADRLTARGMAALDLNGHSLAASAGRAGTTLPVLPAHDMPSLSIGEVGCAFEIAGKSVAALFQACLFAVNTTADREFLNGVHLERGSFLDPKASSLCAVSTNGLKASFREVAADIPDGMPAITVPTKAAQALAKMIESWETATIEVSPSRLIARSQTTVFATKLIEKPYPDWRQVIPSRPPFATYDSAALQDAISTTIAAVKHDKKAPTVQISLTNEEAEFFTRSADGATIGTDACKHSLIAMPDLKVNAAAAGYLLEAIGALAAETIEVSWAPGRAPIVLTAAALPDRRTLVMPIRIAENG